MTTQVEQYEPTQEEREFFCRHMAKGMMISPEYLAYFQRAILNFESMREALEAAWMELKSLHGNDCQPPISLTVAAKVEGALTFKEEMPS